MTKEELIAFRDKVKEAWEAGIIKNPVHLPGGNEDQLIEVFKKIGEKDYVFCTHRNMYHALLHGIDPDVLFSEICKESNSPSYGRSGCMCILSPEHNFYSSAIIGGNCAIAVGVAWAFKKSGDPRRVWCFVGDSVVETGHFFESLNYADCLQLPITFVIEDNTRATCTSNEDRMGGVNYPALCGLVSNDRILYYKYTPTTPHVGSGKYVAF